MHGAVGIVAALPAEARCLGARRISPLSRVELSDRVLIQLSGIGSTGALQAAQSLVSDGVAALVSWGTAAGLDHSLETGAVVLAERVMTPDLLSCPTDDEWRRRLRSTLAESGAISEGAIVQTDELLTTPESKQDLFANTGAVAADMESATIGAVAGQAGIAFVAVRVVLDQASDPLPEIVAHAADQTGAITPRRLIGYLLCHPRELASLNRIARNFSVARRALRRIARRAGPDLSFAK